jgi:hypothetical protein
MIEKIIEMLISYILANPEMVAGMLTVAFPALGVFVASVISAVTKTRDNKFYNFIKIVALQIGRANDPPEDPTRL